MSIHSANDQYKNRGLGIEAERLIVDYAFNELGLYTLYADCVPRNLRSRHSPEKINSNLRGGIMKNFLFLCGSNGIGKTTICRNIVKRLSGSAYVDSDCCRMMNPFALDERTIPTIAKNISGLIENYLDCNVIQTVIFSYGFHGRRKEIFDRIMGNLSTRELNFLPFVLTCGKEENLRRMKADGRDADRIERALETSRKAHQNIEYLQIDITELSVDEATELIISRAGLLLTKGRDKKRIWRTSGHRPKYWTLGLSTTAQKQT